MLANRQRQTSAPAVLDRTKVKCFVGNKDFVLNPPRAFLQKFQIGLIRLNDVIMSYSAIYGLGLQLGFLGDRGCNVAIFLLNEGASLATSLQAVAAILAP